MLELASFFATTELYTVLNLIANILSSVLSHFLLLEYHAKEIFCNLQCLGCNGA